MSGNGNYTNYQKRFVQQEVIVDRNETWQVGTFLADMQTINNTT